MRTLFLPTLVLAATLIFPASLAYAANTPTSGAGEGAQYEQVKQSSYDKKRKAKEYRQKNKDKIAKKQKEYRQRKK